VARLNASVFKLGVDRLSAELKPKPGGLVEPNPRVGVGRLNAILFTSAWADSTPFSFFSFFCSTSFSFCFLIILFQYSFIISFILICNVRFQSPILRESQIFF